MKFFTVSALMPPPLPAFSVISSPAVFVTNLLFLRGLPPLTTAISLCNIVSLVENLLLDPVFCAHTHHHHHHHQRGQEYEAPVGVWRAS